MFCTDATILEHYHQKQQEFGHQEKDAISSGQETKSIIEDEGLKRVMKYNDTNEEYLKVKMDAIRDSRSVC